MKLRAGERLSDALSAALAIVAEKSAEFSFGIVGDLLRNIGAAIVANQSVGRIVFNLRGLRTGVHKG